MSRRPSLTKKVALSLAVAATHLHEARGRASAEQREQLDRAIEFIEASASYKLGLDSGGPVKAGE